MGQHIRKYLRDNKSTRTTKITWTPQNTPELNSLSEGPNRTLLLDSGLPLVFWFKAVKHAVYLIKMLPTKTSKGYISPAEFLTGDAPNASELKIWGCKTWAIVPKEQRRKEWKEKGKPGYYMGVSEQSVGHLIYIPDLDDIVVTAHARFDEQIPYRSQEYFEEIDNHLSTEVLEKAEKVDDYMYLVTLKHYDGHISYITTRVVERKELILAYCKLAEREIPLKSRLQSTLKILFK